MISIFSMYRTDLITHKHNSHFEFHFNEKPLETSHWLHYVRDCWSKRLAHPNHNIDIKKKNVGHQY